MNRNWCNAAKGLIVHYYCVYVCIYVAMHKQFIEMKFAYLHRYGLCYVSCSPIIEEQRRMQTNKVRRHSVQNFIDFSFST